MSTGWPQSEIDAILDVYFDFLTAEVDGRPVVKAQRFRDEIASGRIDRSKGAIQFKLGNVSAVLAELGHPFITGFVPAPNIQQPLADSVLERLSTRHWQAALELLMDNRQGTSRDVALDRLVAPPEPNDHSKPITTTRHVNWDEEARKRTGMEGELWVLAWEREHLRAAGRQDLAEMIVHTSVTDGDGAGFDISSFDEDGSSRLIEVKTTAGRAERPIYASINELTVSRREAHRYWTYRVFDVWRTPSMFQVRGALEDGFDLKPVVFRGPPAGTPQGPG